MVVGLGTLVAAVNLLPKDTARRAAGLVGLSTAMVILSGALKIMSTMSWDDIARSLVTLAGSLGILAGAMALMKKAVPGAIAMTIVAPALVILAGALKILSTLTEQGVITGLVALAVSLGVIAGAMALMRKAIPGAAALLIVSAALAVLAPVLLAFGSMGLRSIGESLLMLAGVFTVFGLAALILQPLVPTMIGLAGALALLGVACAAVGAGVLMVGAGLTMIAVSGSAAALSLTTIVSSLISLIPYLIEQVGVGIIKLCEVIAGSADAICKAATVIIVALVDALVASVPAIVEGAFVLIESLLQALINHTPVIVSAIYDFLIAILNSVAEKLPDLIQAGANVLMAFFSGVINALKDIDPKVLMQGVLAVGFLTVIVTSLAALALLTPLAMIGVLGFGAVVTQLAFVLAAVGALAQIPGLKWLINEGGDLLQGIGTAIGKFIGGIIGGVASGISASLPTIGTNLSLFMTNIQPFIVGAKTIDSKVLEGVGILSAAIIAITAADLLAGITSFITGGTSFAQLGTDLSAFMINATPFIVGAKMIDPAMLDGVKALASTLLVLTGANLLNSLTSWFSGGVSLANFGAELAAFGPYMAQYAASVAGIDAETVVASANAAKALSEVAANLPNSGGIASWFAGENDLDTFGTQIVSFGKCMKEYSQAVQGLDAESVTASVSAAKALTEVANSIPNSGGMASWFAGDNDLDEFGNQLEAFGKGMKAYSQSVVGLDAEAISVSVTAAKSLSEMASGIENSGGMASWFAGDNDLGTFGDNLVDFGKAMKAYSTSVSGIDTAAISASVTAATSLSKLEGTLNNSGGVASWFAGDNDLGTFGDNLVDFGKSMKSYSDEVSGVDTAAMRSSTAAFKKVADLAKGISDIDFDGLSSFGESLGKVGKTGVNKFIKAFSDGEKKTVEAVKNMIAKCVSAIKGERKDFYSAGKYLADGLASGISANSYKVAAKARAMAKAAAKAAEDELDINSPSKVGYEIGDFFGLGFVNAIGDYADRSYKASSSMAISARNGLNEAIGKVRDMLESDIDTQPTIRPILDLSDIKSGASTIGSMIGGDSLIGVSANVGAINSMMKQRSQNGANDDVVYALNKLDKHLDKVGNTTYSIGGITYDDGTNVSEAVRTLVRAVKVERRT